MRTDLHRHPDGSLVRILELGLQRVKLIGILSRTYDPKVAGWELAALMSSRKHLTALLDHLAEHRIGIETNLRSNVQTSSVPGDEAHPPASHFERGILATIYSDDPTSSGIDLRHEYETAASRAGFDRRQIRQAQANALEIAFLSQAEKEALRRQRQAVVADG